MLSIHDIKLGERYEIDFDLDKAMIPHYPQLQDKDLSNIRILGICKDYEIFRAKYRFITDVVIAYIEWESPFDKYKAIPIQVVKGLSSSNKKVSLCTCDWLSILSKGCQCGGI
jgi:hypothetical protein